MQINLKPDNLMVRLRPSASSRTPLSEVERVRSPSTLSVVEGLIYPYFVSAGINKKEEIKSFPQVFKFSIDRLIKDISVSKRLGIEKILLFGTGEKKDSLATAAYKKDNLIALAVKNIKKEFPDLTVITDVCLCGYTSHGHCGILKAHSAKRIAQSDFIDSRKTLEALAKIALSHVEAGADWVAPSAMAKKQVEAIRKELDRNGFNKTNILGYSAKFASNFYGPFRNACGSAPSFGDRSSYQLNYTDRNKALLEISDDIKEGADMVMVKPALGYLDIIKEAKQKFNYPLAAFNVSGEYAMVKAYVKSIAHGARRITLEKNLVLEILTAIKRAGADFIITYHAKEVAGWLK
ncbi:MAG: porphobilinogen synthase [Candidatus Omnitrophota bacterium]|nr:porphobilinogen synthase [Candidatus Omnitrophota bacterium]